MEKTKRISILAVEPDAKRAALIQRLLMRPQGFALDMGLVGDWAMVETLIERRRADVLLLSWPEQTEVGLRILSAAADSDRLL